MVRVATINLLNDLSRWAERRSLLACQLAAASFDLIGLQEVTNPLGVSTAHWLAAELGGYSVHVSPKTGLSRAREGIAVLSRLPVEQHDTLDLRSQQRTAQLVQVNVGGRPLVFANGHFSWPPGAHAARLRQVERLLEWLGTLPTETPVIACGDYNGTPDSPAITLMRRTFQSAHAACHDLEPDFTCPTPLVSRASLRSAITRGLMRLFSNRKDGAWRGTLDYIFVSHNVRVVQCDVFLDSPAPDDPTLYASDHFGLGATLEVACFQ
jgi:endonuclease/exonuclease/phosphatase family metal-dependent hydrolase